MTGHTEVGVVQARKACIYVVNVYRTRVISTRSHVLRGAEGCERFIVGRYRATNHVWDTVRYRVCVTAVGTGHLAFFYMNLVDVSERGERTHGEFPHLEQNVVKSLEKIIIYHLWLFDGQ